MPVGCDEEVETDDDEEVTELVTEVTLDVMSFPADVKAWLATSPALVRGRSFRTLSSSAFREVSTGISAKNNRGEISALCLAMMFID